MATNAPHGHGNFLTADFHGLPMWVYLAAGGVVIAGVFFGPKLLGKGTQSAADQGNPSGTTGANLDPNIDPNTGVPYNIESAIDPSTGLPAYYNSFQQPVTSNPSASVDMTAINQALAQIEQEIAALQRQQLPPQPPTTLPPSPTPSPNPPQPPVRQPPDGGPIPPAPLPDDLHEIGIMGERDKSTRPGTPSGAPTAGNAASMNPAHVHRAVSSGSAAMRPPSRPISTSPSGRS